MKNCKFCIVLLILIPSLVKSQWSDLKLPKQVQVSDIHMAQDILVVSTSNGIFRNAYSGVERIDWIEISTNLPNKEILRMISVESNLIVSTTSGLYYSERHGEHWNKPIGFPDQLAVYDFARDYENHLYAATYDGLWKSKDHGRSWFRLGLEGKAVLSVHVLIGQNSYLAGVAIGPDCGLYRSIDLDSNAELLSRFDQNILCIQSSPFEMNKVITGNYGIHFEHSGLYSFDSHQSAPPRPSGLQNGAVANIELASMPNGKPIVFAGVQKRNHFPGVFSPQGIHYTTEWKETFTIWIDWTDNLNDESIEALLIIDQLVLVGTEKGLYQRSRSDLSSSGTLGACCPIYYNFISGNLVFTEEWIGSKIKIFDISGKKIIETELAHPTINLELISGIYFVQINKNESISTIKLSVN